jgi:hypothetical protein
MAEANWKGLQHRKRYAARPPKPIFTQSGVFVRVFTLFGRATSVARERYPTTPRARTRRSAELNDRILPKTGFSAAQKLVSELHNVGLIAAHTGTILGFVLPEPIDRDLQRYLWDFIVDRYLTTPMVFGVSRSFATGANRSQPRRINA